MVKGVNTLSTMLSVNNNILNKTVARSLNYFSEKGGKAVEKLSSGSRINRAGDDVAAISINAKLDTKLRGIAKAQLNITEVFSLLDVTEAGLIEAQQSAFKIKELYIQALNGTNSIVELNAIQTQINAQVQYLKNARERM